MTRPMTQQQARPHTVFLYIHLFFGMLLLAGCATPQTQPGDRSFAPLPALSPTPPGMAAVEAGIAQATAQAAQAQAQLAAQRATTEAQMATAASAAATAEVEAAIRGTIQSQAATATHTAATATAVYAATADTLAFQATQVAIQATGTAVTVQSKAEQQLVEDEMRRLALQRAQEEAALAYQRQLNALKPYLWGLLALAGVLLAANGLWFVMQRAKPVVIPDPVNGPRVLVPAGSYQVLSAGRAHPPALPAPAPTPALPAGSSPPQILPPLTVGHVLIAGETGSGKSTAMMAVLRRRSQVVVLDPHDDGRTWGQAQVIGGGRNFDAIGSFMTEMQQMLSERYRQRAQGQQQFPPLTVATDEMPAIVGALGRQMEAVWRTWLREGRKVGLFFVVSTQSTRVKTLGIRGEGDLLDNFTYVLMLGKVAAAAFPDLVAGQERPAILRTGTAVRPVIIPYEPEARLLADGRTDEVAEMTADTDNGSGRFIAPTPRYTGQQTIIQAGMHTSRGFVSPAQIARIVAMRGQANPASMRATEEAVWGYYGGAAHVMLQEVEAALGIGDGANYDSTGPFSHPTGYA